VNRKDREGSNVFEGGFLGLDNIGPLDRSALPEGHRLEQADGTGWMGFYALCMAGIAAVLDARGRHSRDLIVKFLDHFALIEDALNAEGLWDEEDGFYYDRLRMPDGSSAPMRVHSIVGLLPLLAVGAVSAEAVESAQIVDRRTYAMLKERRGDVARLAEAGLVRAEEHDPGVLLGVVRLERVLQLLEHVFDESEFLSPYGLRALSRRHAQTPFSLHVNGAHAEIGYEPAESASGMFGGNSNWRGPIWMPVNFLIVDAIGRYARFFGDALRVEYPTGSGRELTLGEIEADLRRRLVSIFLPGADGRRPCFGAVERMQTDLAWKDNLLFHEYFHGDDGAGLGASHQTGWTGLVADLIIRTRRGETRVLSDVLEDERLAA
jgi:hypothetical protein